MIAEQNKIIWQNFKDFENNLESIGGAFISVDLMRLFYGNNSKKVETFIRKKALDLEEKGKGKMFFKLKPQDQKAYQQILKEEMKSRLGYKFLPRSLFISLVSSFDSFIDALLQTLLEHNHHLLSSEKTIKYDELKEFDTLKDIRLYLIENEVSDILRGSHESYLLWFEDKLKLKIKKLLGDDLAMFIELTERRNLFVHSNGVVNKLYIKKCRKAGVQNIEKVKEKQELSLTPLYFKECHDLLYRIALEITYLVSVNLFSKDIDLEFSSTTLNNDVCVELIKKLKYSQVIKILSFVETIDSKPGEHMQKIFAINKALALKMKGDKKEAALMMKPIDRSVVNDEINLAVAIILDEEKEAFRLMEKIGASQEMRESYETDPLFFGIRDSDAFKKIYKKIYKKQFKTNEVQISEKLKFLKKDSN